MTDLDFDRCARLPEPGDNAAIATRRLEAGSRLSHEGSTLTLSHTVLEGHRFALHDLEAGEPILSWGLPFGRARRAVAAGEYLCNARMLEALGGRSIDFELPGEPNFEDFRSAPDLSRVVPGTLPDPVELPGTFQGYRRPGRRGTGTRNFVIVLALTEASAPLAEALAARFPEAPEGTDGVVVVAHTEDGGGTAEHQQLLLRTLAGFVRHANVAAALVVDSGAAQLGSEDLIAWMEREGESLDEVPHAFLRRHGSFATDLERGERLIEGWLPELAGSVRSEAPLSELKLALQCGGSDAFSGVSGNALAGGVARELIRHGGAAGLAETDELIGAEDYILSNVRDAATAERFLATIDRFQARAQLHGASAEGNPSGGNNLRGLYNIALKSIGAARKKDPAVRLDHVIDYGERMVVPGFYFMDSPGNDLESIAGQVASGANLILFITGNGSITNFPFVPTLKFVTTSARFEMLSSEMDVNAGRFGDGESMESLVEETFGLVRRVAGGEVTRGEEAGHAQVSIWRAWRQTEPGGLEALRGRSRPTGEPLPVVDRAPLALVHEALEGPRGPAADQVALVLPTSLCSGQISRIAAQRLGQRLGADAGVTRFVSLVHTEGCGSAGAEDAFFATLTGHLRHPFTRRALLLEHGCEKTHNDAMRRHLESAGVDLERFGFASVQLDGGLDRVCDRIEAWFEDRLAEDGALRKVESDVPRLALTSCGLVDATAARLCAHFAGAVVAAGGSVVVAENATLWEEPTFARELLGEAPMDPTLAYGQALESPGLHIMATPTNSATETISGLAGTGVELILAHVAAGALVPPSSPLVPVFTFTCEAKGEALDLDLALDGDEALSLQLLGSRVCEILSRTSRPRLADHVGFQLTRGLMGISL